MKLVCGNLIKPKVVRRLLSIVPKEKRDRIKRIELVTRKKKGEKISGGWTARNLGKGVSQINMYLVYSYEARNFGYINNDLNLNLMKGFAKSLYWIIYSYKRNVWGGNWAKKMACISKTETKVNEMVGLAEQKGLLYVKISDMPFFYVMKERFVKQLLKHFFSGKDKVFNNYTMAVFDMFCKSKLRKKYRLYNPLQFYIKVTNDTTNVSNAYNYMFRGDDTYKVKMTDDYKWFLKIVKKVVDKPLIFVMKSGRKKRYFTDENAEKVRKSKEWDDYLFLKEI